MKDDKQLQYEVTLMEARKLKEQGLGPATLPEEPKFNSLQNSDNQASAGYGFGPQAGSGNGFKPHPVISPKAKGKEDEGVSNKLNNKENQGAETLENRPAAQPSFTLNNAPQAKPTTAPTPKPM